ncbi:MAG: DUF177 domain-containing protein [Actinomycetaceae bacterium]|nr:DUF177 domain-containing protein [Actinomycetaceae bacterium]
MTQHSDFIIPVADLPKVAGTERDIVLTLPAPEECGVQLIGVPAGEPMEVELRLQTLSEGIFVNGYVSTHVVGQCSRCLTDISKDIEEQVAELLFWPEQRQLLIDEGDEEGEELPVIVDDQIDLEPILRDAIVLSLPFSPLCQPDCQGLCAECGERWEDLPDDHVHEKLNPAFAALDALAAQLAAAEESATGEAGLGNEAGPDDEENVTAEVGADAAQEDN